MAKAMILAGDHRLVILDELTYLMTWGWIDQADVIATTLAAYDRLSVLSRELKALVPAVGKVTLRLGSGAVLDRTALGEALRCR